MTFPNFLTVIFKDLSRSFYKKSSSKNTPETFGNLYVYLAVIQD